jgi:hypothetical protein
MTEKGRHIGCDTENKEGAGALSIDQMRKLLQLMAMMFIENQQKSSGIITNLRFSKNIKWIFDSRVTDHMMGNKNLLYNLKKYEIDQFVTFGNCEKMKILRYSSINLFSKEILNILLVQNCTSNLLSINKVSHELNCEVMFSSKKYVFSRMYNKKGDWRKFS